MSSAKGAFLGIVIWQHGLKGFANVERLQLRRIGEISTLFFFYHDSSRAPCIHLSST